MCHRRFGVVCLVFLGNKCDFAFDIAFFFFFLRKIHYMKDKVMGMVVADRSAPYPAAPLPSIGTHVTFCFPP